MAFFVYIKYFITFEFLMKNKLKHLQMKKTFLSIAIVLCAGFLMTNGYSETKTPVKQQTELFVHSSCFP